MTGFKRIIALLLNLQANVCQQTKQTGHEEECKVSPASYNSQCNYNPFSIINGFTATKTIAPLASIYDLLSNVFNQIDKITQFLCIFIKDNAEMILFGLFTFLALNIVGILFVIVFHNLKIMSELQVISANNKTLQKKLKVTLKKIKKRIGLANSKLVSDLTAVNATTQTTSTSRLSRQRELNEKGAASQTDA
ncbi:unnamed protein product [Litomosoides sigmodontis]|uniref:Uncharacterized protein n=1 Tax=Litomosoides sigmodontis TaxID=42156 RepID=A0A3P6SS97_LITSI|nr:unnamed protein product [Litomosoides sigmodontis]